MAGMEQPEIRVTNELAQYLLRHLNFTEKSPVMRYVDGNGGSHSLCFTPIFLRTQKRTPYSSISTEFPMKLPKHSVTVDNFKGVH